MGVAVRAVVADGLLMWLMFPFRRVAQEVGEAGECRKRGLLDVHCCWVLKIRFVMFELCLGILEIAVC